MVVKDVMYGKTKRKSFARYQEILDMPNLLEVQKNSYQWFLDTGLREVFRDVEAITDYAGNLELSFIDYSMDEKPKYDVEECKARDATYAAPIKVKVRLRNKETEEIKEQEIFMGDFPIMTNSGTFVINGAERVIVSQITRSPGMYFTDTADKADNHTYGTTVIPYRGAWLEYETDLSNVFYVRIDKNRKLPITCLIRAVGPKTDAEIIEMFGEDERILATMEKDPCKTYEEAMLEIYRKLRPGEPPTLDSAETLLNATFYDPRRYDLSAVGRYKFNKKMALWTRLSGRTLALPVADPRTGEIIAEAGETLTRERAKELDNAGVNEAVLDVDGKQVKVFANNMVDMARFVDFDPAYAHALEGSVEAALWPYPGAAEPLGGLTQVDYSADVLSPCYVDSAGQFWGYARYIYGYRFVWICLSDPAGTSVEPDQAVIDRVETRVAELETAQRMQLILAAVLVAAVVAMTLLLILWLRRRMRQS